MSPRTAETPLTWGAALRWTPWILVVGGALYAAADHVITTRTEIASLKGRVATVESDRKEDRSLLERIDRRLFALTCKSDPSACTAE